VIFLAENFPFCYNKKSQNSHIFEEESYEIVKSFGGFVDF
jgi:hypothetical protein